MTGNSAERDFTASASKPGEAALFGGAEKLSQKSIEELNSLVDALAGDFENFRRDQGPLGRFVDGLKGTVGAQRRQEDGFWYAPAMLWSQILDKDNTSSRLSQDLAVVRDRVATLTDAVRRLDWERASEIYAELVASKHSEKSVPGGQDQLKIANLIETYKTSQKDGVDLLSDFGAGMVAIMATRRANRSIAGNLVQGMAFGAIGRLSIKTVDGQFIEPGKDLAMGAAVGIGAPLGNYAGGYLSRQFAQRRGLELAGQDLASYRLATFGKDWSIRRQSAFLKSGTAGATFGAVDAPIRESWRQYERNEEFSGQKIAVETGKGVLIGLGFGTTLGIGADRLVDFGTTSKLFARAQIDRLKRAFTKEEKPVESLHLSGLNGRYDALSPIRVERKDLPFSRDVPELPATVVATNEKHGVTRRSDPVRRLLDLPEDRKSVERAFEYMPDGAEKSRLIAYADRIFEKFRPQGLSADELASIIEAYPVGERALALAILERGVFNSSEQGIRVSMKNLLNQLYLVTGESYPTNVFTLTAESSGNFLAYLYRKSNTASLRIGSFDALLELEKTGVLPNSVVLFDDLASTAITNEQRALLKKIPKVVIVDMNGFEKGMNVLDYAQGAAHVSEKLSALMAEARLIAAQDKRKLIPLIVDDLLVAPVERVKSDLGKHAQVVRPEKDLTLQGLPQRREMSEMDAIDNLYVKLTAPPMERAKIAEYLAGVGPGKREIAAQMILEGAVYNSFPVMVDKSRRLHSQIVQDLLKDGRTVDDLRIYSGFDPGGSAHLVSYIYGRVNKIPSGQFLSSLDLKRESQSGVPSSKAIALLDDTIYSGSQMRRIILTPGTDYSRYGQVIVGALGAFEKGIANVQAAADFKKLRFSFHSPELHQPLHSGANTFYGRLSPADRSIVKNLNGHEGFDQMQGAIIWPYMVPDNNTTFFQQFPSQVLGLQ